MEHAAVMSRRGVDELIDACRLGDRDAFRELFETYKDRVYSIAFHFTGDESTAKDVTQQVFLKLLTHLHQFRRDSAFTTWLFRLVANTCMDEHRRTRRFLPYEPEALGGEPAADAVGDAVVLEHEVADAVRAAVGRLRPKLRLAILLRYFEGLSYEEMAESLGCSKGTVASRLNRGHRILAEKLAHLNGGPLSGDDVC
jgi:RNA polymerase sigma-70 factor (ECF subfamily)